MNVVLIVLAVLVAGGTILQLVLALGFAGKIKAVRQRLIVSQLSIPPDQALIPAVIQAFAARAGAHLGGPAVVRIVQSAEMKLHPDQPFFHIDATQLSGTRNAGFVWDAKGAMAGIVPLRVVDSYVDGEGWLEARIASSIAVANASGMAVGKGEAMRFLAELVWNPDALLNAAGLTWRELDERTVEVSMLTDGGLATVRLFFDQVGDVVGIEADDRPMGTDQSSPPTKWIGRFRDYVTLGEYRVPRFGEVAWVLPTGEFVYWRGEIVKLEAVPH